jgi:hypothetical protein
MLPVGTAYRVDGGVRLTIRVHRVGERISIRME